MEQNGGEYMDEWEENVGFMEANWQEKLGQKHVGHVGVAMEFWSYPSGNERATK